jgi:hypothetical protein
LIIAAARGENRTLGAGALVAAAAAGGGLALAT